MTENQPRNMSKTNKKQTNRQTFDKKQVLKALQLTGMQFLKALPQKALGGPEY